MLCGGAGRTLRLVEQVGIPGLVEIADHEKLAMIAALGLRGLECVYILMS